jgi:hypothetical protein
MVVLILQGYEILMAEKLVLIILLPVLAAVFIALSQKLSDYVYRIIAIYNIYNHEFNV